MTTPSPLLNPSSAKTPPSTIQLSADRFGQSTWAKSSAPPAWTLYRERTWLTIQVVIGAGILGQIVQFLDQLILMSVSATGEPLLRGLVVLSVAIGTIVFSLWLQVGVAICLLKIALRSPVSTSELFQGGPYLLRFIFISLLFGLMIMGATIVCALAGVLLYGLAAAIFPDARNPSLAYPLGVLAAILPLFYVMLRFILFPYTMIDQDVSGLECLRRTWELTRGRTLTLFLPTLTQICVALLGLLTLIVGVFFTVPLAQLMHAVAYVLFAGYRPLDTREG